MALFTMIILFSCIICAETFYANNKLNPSVGWGQCRKMSVSESAGEEEGIKSLLSERVEYIDLGAFPVEPSTTSRSLPLFCLSHPFFPQGTTVLNVFEMKYRTMMFDCANSDDVFGYIHTNSATGQIAAIGTLCKIVNRELLEDGRQLIYIEGRGRFRVIKILKTLPYVLAEVETNVDDDSVPDEDEANKLEMDVYNALKYYIRLLKTYDANREVVISQAMKRTRPVPQLKPSFVLGNIQRRTDFSFALANMIQMSQPREAQLMLQTKSILKRLRTEKEVLKQAAELIADQLTKMKILTPEKKDSIRQLTYNDSFDEDILPMDYIETQEKKEKDEWDLSNME